MDRRPRCLIGVEDRPGAAGRVLPVLQLVDFVRAGRAVIKAANRRP